jgi:hypothetical protein
MSGLWNASRRGFQMLGAMGLMRASTQLSQAALAGSPARARFNWLWETDDAGSGGSSG